MNNYFIKGSKKTPEIEFDIKNKIFNITGVSMSENPLKFYEPLFSWFNEVDIELIKDCNFNFKLEYFNTSSAKSILELLRKITAIEGAKINWVCVELDEDMIEVGMEYQEILQSNFNIVLEKVAL